MVAVALDITGLCSPRPPESTKGPHPFQSGGAVLPAIVPAALKKSAAGLKQARQAEGVVCDIARSWPLVAVPLHELTNEIVARGPKITRAGPKIWILTLASWFGQSFEPQSAGCLE